jgi:SAM-dependent methyltransferase
MSVTTGPPDPETQRRFDDAVRAFTDVARNLYGRDEETIARTLPGMAGRGTQDRLFVMLQNALGVDPFTQPIRYLEVGCGAATFLLSVMERGIDAYGVDVGEESLGLARAKLAYYGMPSEWNARLVAGTASATPFECNSFDLIVGHQFIEHVDQVAATIHELLRVARRGGVIVLWAPDYRGPHEPHYMLPWPLFPTRPMAEYWADCFGRPHAGLDSFNYVTLPQIIAAAQVLGADVVRAWNDRQIDPNAYTLFDTASLPRLRATAERIKGQMAAGTLPESLAIPTSLGIVLRKR